MTEEPLRPQEIDPEVLVRLAPELLHLVPCGAFLADAGATIVAANRTAAELCGLELVGRCALDWPGASPPIAATDREPGDGAGPVRIRWERARAGVADGWLEVAVRPWHRTDGSLGGWLGVLHDVTGQVTAERADLVHRAHLEGVLEAERDAVLLVDDHAQVVSFNHVAELMFGVRRGDTVDLPVELLPAAHRPQIAGPSAGPSPAGSSPGGSSAAGSLDARAPTSRAPMPARRHSERATMRAQRRDGTTFLAEIDTSVVVVDRHDLYTVIVRDLSDRERIERRHRMSDRRFRAAFGQLAVAMAVVSLSGRFVEVNDALCRFLGHLPDELRGSSIEAVTAPEGLPEERALVEEVLAGRRSGYRIPRHRYLRGDGTSVWGDLVVSAVRDDDGATTHLVCQIVDVTDQLRLEHELSEIQHTSGPAARGLAHDLTNLLTIVRGHLEEAQDVTPRSAPTQLPLSATVEALDRCDVLARRMIGVPDDEGHEPSLVDANALVADTAALLGSVLGRDVRLVLRCAAEQRVLSVDASGLARVVLNLVLNAHAALDGPGEIEVATANAAGLGSDADERWLVLTVRDTGGGIPPELVDVVFEPGTSTKDEPGTGLGLTSCRLIVEAGGGSIRVAETSPRGTTMEVRLPVASDPGIIDLTGGAELRTR